MKKTVRTWLGAAAVLVVLAVGAAVPAFAQDAGGDSTDQGTEEPSEERAPPSGDHDCEAEAEDASA